MKQLIECVPNFSEGRDLSIIKQITDQIESVEGIRLLDVDPGKATNRTVVTFVGEPAQVVEAAYLAIKKAGEIIDMRQHSGEHARMGATDVCPLIPVANISMEETVELAKKLGERVGKELNIPVYLYESAASKPERRNLATIRAGEYEGLPAKLQDPNWKPDFGPATFNAQSGATVIGARDFLVAYNINLNTKSTRLANAIAFDVREAGRIKREGHPVLGEVINDENGEPIRIPGTLKSVKAVGWYIEEYGFAQISMNLTNINVTSVHRAFDEVVRAAQERGVRVTGSELVGLIPLRCMLEAGRHYLAKMGRSEGVSEEELIETAIRSMGLNELGPFDPKKKIIEYLIAPEGHNRLVSMDLRAFANETASESPAPGGGSIAAYAGAMGVSLAAMVANLSAAKRGWEEQTGYFSEMASKAQALKEALLYKVDEDTRAFDAIMNAFALPKNSDQEKKARSLAIQEATKIAIEVPLQTMRLANEAFEIIQAMAEKGNPNSITDAAVGALCARAAVYGGWLNVKVNLGGFKDQSYAAATLAEAAAILAEAQAQEAVILDLVAKRLGA
ncbi:MAG: glutamate formimidoyltransferase [Sphingobacteriaceae bacterium]|nr:glutamate formimidoyltransferase [Sphingobacteriaceae bacterium]